jgi:hypothetical protein
MSGEDGLLVQVRAQGPAHAVAGLPAARQPGSCCWSRACAVRLIWRRGSRAALLTAALSARPTRRPSCATAACT